MSIDDSVRFPLDGLLVGRAKRRQRFALLDDGEIHPVDGDFDRSVMNDPQAAPKQLRGTSCRPATFTRVESEDAFPHIAELANSLLHVAPNSLIAIACDSKGRLLGATFTTIRGDLSVATFRASFRSLPSRTKIVTFASRTNISRAIKDAVTATADVFLMRLNDLIVISK